MSFASMHNDYLDPDRYLDDPGENDFKDAADPLKDLADEYNQKVYLCGPINGCTDSECKDWREFVKSWGIPTVDPMERDYRGKEDECFAEIVELDKRDIDMCDVVLVNYDKPSVGTSMEILYAWERGKRVIVVRNPQTKISPWLKYHAHSICASFADAKLLLT